MPDGERRKLIDIEICRSKVKVTTSKNRPKIRFLLKKLKFLMGALKQIGCSTKTIELN
jgi:hypothetical protein